MLLPHGFVTILLTDQLYLYRLCTMFQTAVSNLLIADLVFDLLAPDSGL